MEDRFEEMHDSIIIIIIVDNQMFKSPETHLQGRMGLFDRIMVEVMAIFDRHQTTSKFKITFGDT